VEAYGGIEVKLHSFLTLVLEEDEWPNVGSSIPEKEPLVPWRRWVGGPYNRSVIYMYSYTSKYRLLYSFLLYLKLIYPLYFYYIRRAQVKVGLRLERRYSQR
jgi:hypothetical protein